MKRSTIIALATLMGMAALLLVRGGRDSPEEMVARTESGREAGGDHPKGRSVDRDAGRGLRETPERQRERLLESLRAASQFPFDSVELIKLIAELKEAGLLLDKEVLEIYERVISNFSAEDLGKVALAWPSDDRNSRYSDEFRAIARVFRDRDDPAQLLTFLKIIPPDHGARREILFKTALSMQMFVPDRIGSYLSQFSEADKKAISEGLVAKLRGGEPDQKTKLEIIQKYLDETGDTVLTTPLLKLRLEMTARNDPEAALKWVKGQDPKVAEQLDEPIIQSLVGSHPEQAAEYLNAILESGNPERSQKAMEYMAKEYSQSNPLEALNWVLALPKNLPVSDQMIVDPFVQLKRTDPEKARAVMNEAKDPKLRALFTHIWEIAN